MSSPQYHMTNAPASAPSRKRVIVAPPLGDRRSVIDGCWRGRKQEKCHGSHKTSGRTEAILALFFAPGRVAPPPFFPVTVTANPPRSRHHGCSVLGPSERRTVPCR